MTESMLETTLQDLFDHAIPRMKAEQPKKFKGEGERIYDFAFNSFQVGFLYGMTAGCGVADELKDEVVRYTE